MNRPAFQEDIRGNPSLVSPFSASMYAAWTEASEMYPEPAEVEPTTESVPQTQGFRTVASQSGHLVLQEMLPAHFSTGGVDFSTNGHRTAQTNRLVPESEPLTTPARTILWMRKPGTIVFKHVVFGADLSEGGGLHVPAEPPAHEMNARLLIPKGMQVDHEGRSLETVKNPQLSTSTILEAARKQFDTMARRYPRFPIKPVKAVDDVIRRSPGIAREENVDPGASAARQRAEVPSTIDPIKLYEKVVADFSASHPPTAERAPSIDPIVNRVRLLLASGRDPLRVHYEAAKEVVLLEWRYQDGTRSDTAQRGREAIRHERRYLSALLEHRRAMSEIAGVAIRSTGSGGKPLKRPPYIHY